MKIYNSIDQLIGNTPLLELQKIEQKYNLKAKIYAKIEAFNPSGSVKDRIAKAMLDQAEKDGVINKDTTIIEPTSGNTGIGLAMVSASRGYKLILTMPETMSVERRNTLKAYGAEIVLTEGGLGMKGAIAKANELSKEISNSFIPSQFTNMANPEIHFNTTAVEIFNDTDGDVDVFIAGVGTGGTVSGVGKFLKQKIKNVKIIAVEPQNSPAISKGISGPHKIQGIGAGFIPNTLNLKVVDEVITATDLDAFEFGKDLAKTEGVFAGISSGAVLSVAVKLAQQEEYKNKKIVVLLPDSGDRYLSTALFN